MAKNELLPFADGEDANVLPTNQWEALTDILENGFQSGIARSEQVNRVLAQGAVASYVLGQLIVDQLNKDATLDKSALYQNLILALQENAKNACLPLSGGNVTGNLTVQGKNVVRSVNNTSADANGNVAISVPATPKAYVTTTWKSGNNWYRKWSDGWIEQGGNDLGSNNPTTHTITFPVAFTKVHSLVVTGTGYQDSRTYETGIVNGSVTLTGFSFQGSSASSDNNNSCSWVAYGYYK